MQAMQLCIVLGYKGMWGGPRLMASPVYSGKNQPCMYPEIPLYPSRVHDRSGYTNTRQGRDTGLRFMEGLRARRVKRGGCCEALVD